MPLEEDTEAYQFLRKTGLEEVEAFKLLNIIREMASTNIIARLESKIEAQTKAMNTEMKAQNMRYNLLIWMIGIGVVLLIASNFLN